MATATGKYYVGVQPYAVLPERIGRERIVFLVGREHTEKNWNGSEKWSSFGGAPEGGDAETNAAREWFEETMGMFGDEKQLAALLRDKSISSAQQVGNGNATEFLLRMKYDALAPAYFRNVYKYFLRCAHPHPTKVGYMKPPSCPEGYFEKTDLMWISLRQVQAIIYNTWSVKDDGEMPLFRPDWLDTMRTMIERNLPQLDWKQYK